MLRVKYRQARLPRTRFDRQLFCNHVEQLFQVNSTTANLLVKAVEAAIKQRHGTMLVITPEAESETQRLAAQSTVIEPVIVSQSIISHLSNIDGAILLSPEGIIHSFGVILDGQASKNGSSARGARYNSAIRYIDEMSRKVNCLALIVSEDGYVDLYSTLTNQ
jgi:DNA integrity scanning protein DisA with diadenylate cyclase activity